MRKGSEVRNIRLLDYNGRIYHVAHNSRNELYLCDCSRGAEIQSRLVGGFGVRSRVHKPIRQDEIMFDLRLRG